MTSKEFVIWLKGFTEGVHDFNVTPKQWELLKNKLEEVNDEQPIVGFPFGVPNATPTWQHPHYVDPYNPYKITCTPGTTITTTPGVTGYVTTTTNQNLDKNEGTTNDMP